MADHGFFSELMEKAGPYVPHKEVLWDALITEARELPLTREDEMFLWIAFNISFEGHVNTPARKSKEAYFYHPLRTAFRIIWQQVVLQIYDLDVIIEALLHDCFEETAPGIDSILLRTNVIFQLGETIANDVWDVTKHKELGESNEEYCLRLLNSNSWRALWVKFMDRIDNMWSIGSMSTEQRVHKIEETKKWFPELKKQLVVRLSAEELTHSSNPSHQAWRELPIVLHHNLMFAIAAQGKQ